VTGRAKRFAKGTRASAGELTRIADRANELSSIRGDRTIDVRYSATSGLLLGVNVAAVREQIAAAAPFVVSIEMDGGVAGGAAAECNYTYTVKDLTATSTLGTEITPETPRQHYMEYWYAGETRTAPAVATSNFGLACIDASGQLTLLVAYGEILKDTVCAV